MRRVLGDILTRLGVDDDCIADLLLAVTEACTNVLRHCGHGRRYEVVAEIRKNRCLLEVVDSGRGFDPAKLAVRRPRPRGVYPFRRRRTQSALPPRRQPRCAAGSPGSAPGRKRAIAQLPESGRGLAIMRACVDDVTLSSQPGQGTVVSLQKRIELRDDAPRTHPDSMPLRDAG